MDFIKLASVLDNLCRIDAVQNQEVLKHLFDALQNSQAAPCGKNLVLLDGTEATAAFLLVNWVFRETIEENLESLATISVLLKSTFAPPCGAQIKQPRIDALMQLAITQLPHLDRLFVEDPVTVILADNTCPHANGLYYTNTNISDQQRDLIVLTWIDNDLVSPEFAFLHELGHLVHTRITGKLFVAPHSFKTLYPLIETYSHQPIPCKRSKRANRWLAEWFAEFFAIAVLHGSLYSHLDYHSEISDTDRDIIQIYMRDLCLSLT